MILASLDCYKLTHFYVTVSLTSGGFDSQSFVVS